MKVDREAPRARTRRLKAWLNGNDLTRKLISERPFRSELFNLDQLRQHAIELAESQKLDPRAWKDHLLPRLAKNEEVLLKAHGLVTQAAEAHRALEPAAEWLLDNFYLVQEQIRTARRHLPKTYGRELPKLAEGPCAGFPRVYELALELISHADGKIDGENLQSFVSAYQSVTPLKLGELWAIPIMFRLALIENLRRVSAQLAGDRVDRDHADYWADRMMDTAEKAPRDLILVMADMARSDPQLSGAFVAELSRRLQGHGPALAFALTWIEQRLSEKDLTIERLVQLHGQQQAADQVSIGNSINSLRFLESSDWREFVESMSVVEQILATDPAQVHKQSDFATRDHCRHVIERTAKQSPLSEQQIAWQAVDLARAAADTENHGGRANYVGYYLIGNGRGQLERAVQARISTRKRASRFCGRHALALYLGAIAALTLLAVAGVVALSTLGGAPVWAVALAAALASVAFSQLAVSLVHWGVPFLVRPETLPRLDFSKGIPQTADTLVAVPAMLSRPAGVEKLLETIEIHYLANRESQLHFALLTDFVDAHERTMPEDEQLVQIAREGIARLNQRYAQDRDAIFYLLHRPRRWNAQERVWMGHERKRGKLQDLNAVLRGAATDERFSVVVGDLARLQSVRFVVTLDADTQLPRDTARELAATMAHPLNRPVYDQRSNVIRDGYGILQPRIATDLESGNRSWFVKLFGDEPGVDPYTRVVSDVYQDVFGEGSFIGKGIYDVDAMQRTLAGRLPDNLILSHDLLEGCYARSGLVSDIQLYEDYPSRYNTDVSRRHRWIRGDWQICHWIWPTVRLPDGKRAHNPLSMLSRWKIFDNLRRSLVAFSAVALLIVSWALFEGAWIWTLAVAAIYLLPMLLGWLVELARKPDDVPIDLHLRSAMSDLGKHLARVGLRIALLAHEAYYSLDAITRTLVRMYVTHRKLLAWRTASETALEDRGDLAASLRSNWISPAVALACAAYLAFLPVQTLVSAAPLLIAWFISPALSWFVSLPIRHAPPDLSAGDTRFLRALARKTWRFFEVFIGPEENWLPPDNYQEYPVAVIAHRTSPTNIGLALLTNLAAYDFGYIGMGMLLARTSATFRTLEKLERFRGHFYNWYDTRTLSPLVPKYVSTVDSGNFAAHLLTLQAGLRELGESKVFPPDLRPVADTLRVFLDNANPQAQKLPSLHDLEGMLERLESTPESLEELRSVLEDLQPKVAAALSEWAAQPQQAAAGWISALDTQLREYLEELQYIAPWTALLKAAPKDNSDGFRELLRKLNRPLTLSETARLQTTLLPTIEQFQESVANQADVAWLTELHQSIAEASHRATQRMELIESLVVECGELADIEYDFLYSAARDLLTIGYNVDQRRQDTSYYDLLASEARLCSFIGIAASRLPQSHWFAMGRLLTTAAGQRVLLSWSGSMFEYLMPHLVMPSYENSLLDQTCRAAVHRQKQYGAQRGVPWGMSESGYNVTDVHLNYQYRAFGVPGLGFKRGLADDLVVAPYASMMALIVEPQEACANLKRMAADGYLGHYGFYEAIDFTPSRVPRGQTSATVRSFMAHHQGMGFVALDYLLCGRPMQRRFQANPAFRATDLLLQERIPKAAPFYPYVAEAAAARSEASARESAVRIYVTPHTQVPEVQLLSNGRYHVMITTSGGGYSRWHETAVTRWREDATLDNHGTFCYVRDTTSGDVWSSAYQPTLEAPDKYEAIFSQGRAEFRRRDHGIEMHTDIAVSPEDDVEIRRIQLYNRSRARRTLELTSYFEIVLTHPAADVAHPSFSNLFVQTEIDAGRGLILATRRPRSGQDQMPWMAHLMAVRGATVGEASYETSRAAFLGRGRSAANPVALEEIGPLQGSQGSVLDPIGAIRRAIVIEPDESATIDLVMGIADSREAALALGDKYGDPHLADRVFDLATTHSHVILQQLNINEHDSQLYGRLASWILYPHASRRAPASVLLKNTRGQSGLWGYGISGDSPIVLVRIGDQAKIELVRKTLQAHAYWRSKGLAVDLVIWNEDHSGYRQQLQDQIMGLIAAGVDAQAIERPGGIFVRRAEQMPDEDRILLQTVARVVLSDTAGTLAEQIARRIRVPPAIDAFVPTEHRHVDDGPSKRTREAPRDLRLFNGLGGFAADGREYVIVTSASRKTPAPWANVLANEQFGSVVSEAGGAYTWHENAHEFRLTPWYNDPVTDASGEAFYIRDEETGKFHSPTALPAGGSGTYVTRHGFGYSVFECVEQNVASEMWTFVALDAPVKFVLLRLRNESSRSRRLSIYAYLEWVLSEQRSKGLLNLITAIDAQSGALFARNPYNSDFPDRVAFLEVSETTRTVTGDRTEFLGRNRSPASPAALERVRLSGTVGAALDPCGAMQVQIELGAGQQRDVAFIVGAGNSAQEARATIGRYRGTRAARQALEAVKAFWERKLSVVSVKTPDEELNLLANGWLVYQTLACRMWARSGYYQSGGAFGFRDQLQDSMALVHAAPDLARAHLLRSAAHQFREGDVQHWWHPPTSRGVRTHFSDDYLWLPLAAWRYVTTTGDTGVLDEPAPFIEGRPCKPDEEAYYDLPLKSEETGSLYEHCVRSIQHGLKFGQHGLPLMGCGDWNDGMNLVGADGKGESVWLAFFLFHVLTKFSELAQARNDAAFAEQCLKNAETLRAAIEQNAWDGNWYRRAYFDDGTPLGSASNEECQIDSLPQSWGVLSAAAEKERAATALEFVDRRLVDRPSKLIKLFTPPFDKSPLEPGYIKGYVPGVRENGGQYTHAAVWAVMAFAQMKDARAWELARMINPVVHGATNQAIEVYKVEPYVVAADVYAVDPHVGRGGWTWYTGSAGWMYRMIVESWLGLHRRGDRLTIDPHLPKEWPSFEMHYRYRDTSYHIMVQRDPHRRTSVVRLDGVELPDKSITLADDRSEHLIEVVLCKCGGGG